MKRLIKIQIMLAVAVLVVLPASAAVKVDYEVGVDFESYRTYAWQAGEPAGQPQVEQWIAIAVERELAAAGLRKVEPQMADLYVTTRAFSRMDAAASGGYIRSDVYGIGVLTSDVVVQTKGYLIVDLIDARSDLGVWRGLASEVMGLPTLEKLRKKVNKVTKKMFRQFPP